MSHNMRHSNLVAVGVPAMAAGATRVPLGAPYKTTTGQWVVLSDGNTEWCGTGDPTTEPSQAIIDAVAAEYATAIPTLSVNTPSQVIAANNSATGTVVITDSRGADANGKTVKIKILAGGGAIDGDSYVLAGAGQATINFQATNFFTGELRFLAYYDSGETDPVGFTVRRGSA